MINGDIPMKKIYVFAVYTGQSSYGVIRDAEPCGDTMGYAINVDPKKVIVTHYSSGINWTQHDMGITSDWKHDIYQTLYPDGYELVWLGGFESFDEGTTVAENMENNNNE